ncbi:HNH endonuclease [Pseudomonas umsongensis]|uniref:HNH endonuclease n=1 Tax=Pseudomonas umsongensis TaxID=198618 RepID=UPI003D7F21D4
MLFPYGRIRHRMRAMHGFISYIFSRVWCRAPNVEYSIELFDALPSLYSIMNDLYLKDLAGVDTGAGAFFYRYINEIFLEFKNLTPAQIASYRKMFMDNNDIQALCEGKKEPTRYPDAPDSVLMGKIENFFSKLYSGGFFDLAVVKKNIGTDLREHYKAFAEFNGMPCCPFCGLMPMDSEFDPSREAYDHYLPSSKYPFNSVNLKNLAPSCYKCNSQSKGAKDPLLNDAGVRTKAFYPYLSSKYPIKVSVHFKNPHQLPVVADDISITLDCAGHEEEVETWDRLYKVRTRYAAKCLSVGAKYWLQRVLEEKDNYNLASQDLLTKELDTCKDFPWHDTNFLKNAFLVESLKTSLIKIRV